MLKNSFILRYSVIFSIALLVDKIFLNFADVSNDTSLLSNIGSHPLNSVTGQASDPQMPPFLGFALFPAHFLGNFGFSSVFSLRVLFFVYSLLAVHQLKQIMNLCPTFKGRKLLEFSVYFNLIIVVLILTQEDILGYFFVLAVIHNLLKRKFIYSLILLVLASLIAKILFILFIFPLALQILKTEKYSKLKVYLLSVVSPAIWALETILQMHNGKETILDFKLPLFYSSNAWSFISEVSFFTESFLRNLSGIFLIFGFCLTLYLVGQAVSFRLWFPFLSLWIMFAAYQFQPEYSFFALPFTLLHQKSSRNIIGIAIFPIALLQNFVFSFSNRNSQVLNSAQKQNLIDKVVNFAPFLGSDNPSYIIASIFSMLIFSLSIYLLYNKNST